jgi:F-type H+-transporting ATPase subunit epsilon
MPPTLMNLKVLLPFQIFAEKTGVSRIVAETREGSFGLCRTGSIVWRRSCRAF